MSTYKNRVLKFLINTLKTQLEINTSNNLNNKQLRNLVSQHYDIIYHHLKDLGQISSPYNIGSFLASFYLFVYPSIELA